MQLANDILDALSPKNLHETLVDILTEMEIVDFFSITASLIEVNLLKATKEAVTTASGQL